VKRIRWLALAVFALLLAGCVAEGRMGGSVIGGGSHAIGSGVVLDGHLVMLDGRFDVADGATISGSAFVIGGELRLRGRLDGDLTLVSGAVELGPRAAIGGDVRLAGGTLSRDPAAVVAGKVVTGLDADAALGLVRAEDPSPAEQLIRFAIQLAALLLLAAFIARWLPRPSERISNAVQRRALLAVAVGLLAVLVGLPLVVFMAFTVVLIPVALILVLGAGLALAIAWVSLGAGLGRLIHARTDRLRSTLAQAVVGTLLLTTGAGLLGLLPLIGDVVIIGVLLACIGAGILTRLGMAPAPVPRG
jgi:cytoskeletal protein CcmA (bactofilin family)